MNAHFCKVTEPELDVIEALNRWENDAAIVPLTRPHKTRAELEVRKLITAEDLSQRLEFHHMYLIHIDNHLVGEMNFMVDPPHLLNKEPGTAWIGITIGEPEGRGKGLGHLALEFLEDEIKRQGLKRIELGVFEFNKQAHQLYKKLGYKEIGRISDFTYFQDRMWADIRMEKYL